MVLALALVAVLVVLAVLSAAVAAAVGTHRRVQGAADLAALAGASAAASGPGRGVCAEVGRIAAANSAQVRSCLRDGPEVAVVLEAQLHLGPYAGTLSARARAGPAQLLD